MKQFSCLEVPQGIDSQGDAQGERAAADGDQRQSVFPEERLHRVLLLQGGGDVPKLHHRRLYNQDFWSDHGYGAAK